MITIDDCKVEHVWIWDHLDGTSLLDIKVSYGRFSESMRETVTKSNTASLIRHIAEGLCVKLNEQITNEIKFLMSHFENEVRQHLPCMYCDEP